MGEGRPASVDFNPYELSEVIDHRALGYRTLFILCVTAFLVFSASLICVLGTLLIGVVLWLELSLKRQFDWGTIRELVPLPAIAFCVTLGLLIAMFSTRAVVLRVVSRFRLLAQLTSRRAEMHEQLREYRKSVSEMKP